MDSLKIILDTVPSELIAVDTVGEESSDGSLDIVKEYTDKIVHFDWTGDFAAARNAGLELAKGEWFLYVDDDEWFEDPAEIIEFFKSGEYLNYGCTQYAIHSYFDESLSKYSEAWVSRMVRLTPETRFIHPVHELFYPAYGPEKKFPNCYAHHVGYVFKNKEERQKHFQRNITPILEELERCPDNLRLIMQAVQEYQFNNECDKALEYCRRGVAIQPEKGILIWNQIAAALVQTLILLKRNEDALTEGKYFLEMSEINELTRMNLDYLLIGAAQDVKDIKTALQYAEDYRKLEQYFDENPDKVYEQVMLSLSDILSENKRKTVHKFLFMTYKKEQSYEEMCAFADGLSWDKDYMKQKLLFFLVVEASAYTDNYDCLARTIQKICKQDVFPQEWLDNVKKVCNCEEAEKKYHLCKAFSQVVSEDSYFQVLRAWCIEQDGGDIQGALQECLNQGLDCAVPREELLGVCLRTGFDPTPFLEPLYMEDWVVSLSQLVKHTSKDELQNLLDCAQNTLRPLSEQQSFVLSKMVRQRMLDDPDFPEEQLWETARAYAGDILGYYQIIYRTELFEHNIKQNLPREAIFALKLQEALQERKCGDLKGMTYSLKECVKAYPPQKDLVSRLLEQIELDMQAEQQRQDEFMKMGETIKQQIHHIIQLGKFPEAQEILGQLKALLPNDAELEELEQKISMGERLKNLQSLMH